jgi:hypothetical protein
VLRRVQKTTKHSERKDAPMTCCPNFLTLQSSTRFLLACVGHAQSISNEINSSILAVGQPNHLKSIGWLNPFGRAISPIDIVGFYFWYGGS